MVHIIKTWIVWLHWKKDCEHGQSGLIITLISVEQECFFNQFLLHITSKFQVLFLVLYCIID